MWLLLLACRPPEEGAEPPLPPAPDAWEPPSGPGGPSRTFSAAELHQPCGHVLGGPGDAEHHNLSVMHDGYLVHPWAPEDGGGGISFFAFDDPCNPELVGQAWSDRMRETHTLAFGEADGREYLAVDALDPEHYDVGGVGFWDITDRSAPVWVSEVDTPNFAYPDSYLRVTFSSFWQGDVLYVAAAFNGIHVIDVSDPTNPVLVTTYKFDPPHLVGSFTVVGNVGMAASAGTQRVWMMDVSDPLDPQPLHMFDTVRADGLVDKYYFSSVSGRYGLFARNERGGGPIVYDLTDPVAPAWVGEAWTPDGDGGYVYRQGERLFQGDSTFAALWDFSDPSAPTEIVRYDVPGDVDTISPIGNVAIVSVDEGGDPGQASSVFPWQEAPETDPPAIELTSPAPDERAVAHSSRIGVSFDEWVERATVFEGSFRVTDADGWPIEGGFNVQENVVNFTPREPLPADAVIRVVVPAGGITDLSGNPVQQELSWQFTTSP